MSALPPKADMCSALADVRFGSLADICTATSDVCFTPDSDHESGLRQTVMSALPPKADMCAALGDVSFGPIADSCAATKRKTAFAAVSPKLHFCFSRSQRCRFLFPAPAEQT